MPIHNSDVAERLDEIADLLAIEEADLFRIRAYRNAARTIRSLSREVADMVESDEDLTELPDVGESIASKIRELVETGSLEQLVELESEVPVELRDILRVEGLGPKRTATLHHELGIETLDDLEAAAEAGRVRELDGFGEKTEQSILEHVDAARRAEERTLLSIAEERAGDFFDLLDGVDETNRVVIAGSFRRRKETVGDLDVLVTCDDAEPVMEAFVEFEDVDEVVSRGETRSTIVTRGDFQVDLRVVPDESYGAALHYFTGSKSHNIACRERAVERGYKLNEYGVFDADSDERLGGESEEEVYELLEMEYVEPELRENRGELEAAEEGTLPELVEYDELRGDLHAHTTASDGRNTVETMAEAAARRGLEYLAITDHSQAVSVTGGLDAAKLTDHADAIRSVDETVDGIELLTGCEVDILEDGSLDLPDDALAELDVVICAIHSGFDLDAGEQTDRIVSALENPHTAILGHPSGRMIHEREAYDVHMETVIEAAVDFGVALEIDSQPNRLDLDDVHCQRAREAGATFVVSSDAHSTDQLDYLRWGVDQARRGWLEADDILNTRSVEDVTSALES
ncbi:MAG: DNA polymerase/3'-5' exonuclease PolX [Bradymonadaceae bacterium]